MTDRIEAREGEENSGAFRGPYYDFVGRIGPYPQGPTLKGIHTPPDADAPVSELAVDDQTANEVPTTEKLLQVRPRTGEDPVEGDFEPMEPELEPDPGEPGVPVIAEQPGFAHGDPGTGLENIHTEDPDAGPGPEPEPTPELVITAPVDGSTVPPVHDITGTGASSGGEVALWYMNENRQVATTTADADGAWAFTGDEATAFGPATYEVRQGSHSSPQITVTVEETPPARAGDDEWQRLTRHADIDDYLDGRKDLARPDSWMGLTVADKKAWLDRNAR
jgi:hypothetical protein